MDLLVQLHHEDDEEDDGEDHLADGHGGVASVQRRGVADDDNEAEDLTGMRGGNGKQCSRKPLREAPPAETASFPRENIQNSENSDGGERPQRPVHQDSLRFPYEERNHISGIPAPLKRRQRGGTAREASPLPSDGVGSPSEPPATSSAFLEAASPPFDVYVITRPA